MVSRIWKRRLRGVKVAHLLTRCEGVGTGASFPRAEVVSSSLTTSIETGIVFQIHQAHHSEKTYEKKITI